MAEDNVSLIPLEGDLLEVLNKERAVAIKRFLLGKTHPKAILERDGPKDDKGNVTKLKYVPAAYMTRQVGLVTGFKWSHKVTGRRTLPDWWKAVDSIKDSKKDTYTKDEVLGILQRCIRDIPKEIMTDVEVKVFDAKDREFFHTGTGTQAVKYLKATPTIPVSIGNAEMASETKAIKKALANMGFCPDVYGPKEIQELEEEDLE